MKTNRILLGNALRRALEDRGFRPDDFVSQCPLDRLKIVQILQSGFATPRQRQVIADWLEYPPQALEDTLGGQQVETQFRSARAAGFEWGLTDAESRDFARSWTSQYAEFYADDVPPGRHEMREFYDTWRESHPSAESTDEGADEYSGEDFW